MTRPIRDLDVPLTVLQQQMRALVARRREQAAGRSAERLAAVLAPTHTTPEEGR